MVVGIGAGYLDGFLPNMRVGPEFRIPVKFDQFGGPLRIDEAKGVHPKPSIMRRLRGIPRSDITHMTVWMDSGINDIRSQNVSCADRSEEHTSEIQSLMRIA